MAHLSHVNPQDIELDPGKLQRAYELLESWTEGAQPAVPGGAILVGRHGKVVAPKFFGRQGPEPGAEPIRPDGMFLLASISKPITYLGAMILVERGLLSLSDLVTHYLPEFAAHHKEETRVSHLFTHTSGMPDMLPENAEMRRTHATLETFMQGAIRDTVPLFPAGTDFSYQSMGTLVVAKIIQELSGLRIDQFLKREIFDPLGLKSIGLGSKGLRAQTPGTRANARLSGGQRLWLEQFLLAEFGAPWGGMFSTPEDFAVICQMLLNGGKYGDVRLLAPDTVRMMTTNRLDDYPDVPEAIRRTQPWGLGWQLNPVGTSKSWSDLLDRNVFGHTGATGTMAWIDRQRDGFCLLFTTAIRSRAPWRLVHLSNAIAASFQ